jgi:hypothetical protein
MDEVIEAAPQTLQTSLREVPGELLIWTAVDLAGIDEHIAVVRKPLDLPDHFQIHLHPSGALQALLDPPDGQAGSGGDLPWSHVVEIDQFHP